MDKNSKLKYYGWRLGDRYDGWRVRKADPMFSVAPFLLPTRVDSEVFYQVKIPIDIIEIFIKKHKQEMPDLSIMHVVIASLVRLISQRPYLNRFIVWNKIFARNHVSFSIVIKRAMNMQAEETVIKPYYLPTDSLKEVVEKTNLEVINNQKEGHENSSDFISKMMNYLPDFLLRTLVFMIKQSDRIGLMPKLLFNASPFHSSIFLTNLGSIGIDSIYHHLYEFGTCSIFGAMGKKMKKNVLENDGTIKAVKSIQLKFVLDERICDGFYYASSMRLLEKILNYPEQLILSPENVVIDDGVGKKRIDI